MMTCALINDQLRYCSRIGPFQWIQLARVLHENRAAYDAFLVVHGTIINTIVHRWCCDHAPSCVSICAIMSMTSNLCPAGTDTMAYTACALSLMLAGFRKPIVLTGSQLPLTQARSDARQNLVDSLTGACTCTSLLDAPICAVVTTELSTCAICMRQWPQLASARRTSTSRRWRSALADGSCAVTGAGRSDPRSAHVLFLCGQLIGTRRTVTDAPMCRQHSLLCRCR